MAEFSKRFIALKRLPQLDSFPFPSLCVKFPGKVAAVHCGFHKRRGSDLARICFSHIHLLGMTFRMTGTKFSNMGNMKHKRWELRVDAVCALHRS